MKKLVLCLFLVGCTNQSYEPAKPSQPKVEPTSLPAEEIVLAINTGGSKTYLRFEIDNKICISNYFDASLFCYDK